MEANRLTEEIWQAIVSNDAAYDGSFLYAIKTTGIFCKPSCKSKIPNKENVRIFQDAEAALSANYRPCKRCKPTHARLPDEEWVEQIVRFIRARYREPLNLQSLADMCHGSPYHLHRTFKRLTGMTPAAYIRQLRMNEAKAALLHTERTIEEIAVQAGMANLPYFITLFKKMTGMTPNAYRSIHRKQLDPGGELP